jgi:hypothetical protein
MLSLVKFFGITSAAMSAAWFAHPHLLSFAGQFFHLDFKDSVTAFQTSFFSFLSLVFAIYSGNTMAFLYDRQKEMVKNLYSECMALEELLEEAVYTLGPDARDILAQIRTYIEIEIQSPENQSPPLGEGLPLALIRNKARNYRRAGTDVGEILQASQRLAHAQSTRQATACKLLPPVHWALLYSIGTLFVVTFILFETGGSFSNEGRHILFTVLCGLMSFVLTALRDLADPAEGVYNATALLDERLSYITNMLDKYQKLPRSQAIAGLGGYTGPLNTAQAVLGDQLDRSEEVRAELAGANNPVSQVVSTVTDMVVEGLTSTFDGGESDRERERERAPAGTEQSARDSRRPKDGGNSDDDSSPSSGGSSPSPLVAKLAGLRTESAQSQGSEHVEGAGAARTVNSFDEQNSFMAVTSYGGSMDVRERDEDNNAMANSAVEFPHGKSQSGKGTRQLSTMSKASPSASGLKTVRTGYLGYSRDVTFRWTSNGLQKIAMGSGGSSAFE